MRIAIKQDGIGAKVFVVDGLARHTGIDYDRLAVFFVPGNTCPVAEIALPSGEAVTALVESVVWETPVISRSLIDDTVDKGEPGE